MSWYQLDTTLKQQAEYVDFYKTTAPVACPNDGEPLVPGPPTQAGSYYCRFDGWQYPRDYDPELHQGM